MRSRNDYDFDPLRFQKQLLTYPIVSTDANSGSCTWIKGLYVLYKP